MSANGEKRLGPYEIVASIGKGGMGEVYRAEDTRLNRTVAIKVSSEKFTERFEREARVVASLNHPNICHLYDVGPNYLVMELVEGQTLAEQLAEGRIPLEEAVNIARQIADALEAAHVKGITHRDLKPGNIKITPDGTVKVLDFGLAKVGGTPTAPSDNSPTVAFDQTEAGVILGTVAYMSPEQAKGKPVDQRGDIYAFGAVLYEMVTGTRLHRGETTSEVLASVIRDEPKWDKVPPQLHRLLRRCLEKDLQKRQRHIGDVMALVDDAPTPSMVAPQVGRKRWLGLAAAAGVIAVVGALAWWAPWKTQSGGQRVQFEIQPASGMTFIIGGYPMVSPNGKWVVIPAMGSDGVTRMWLRALDSVEFRPLVGTESGNALPPPVFWSHDSRFIAFASTPGPFAPGQLKKLDISGGPPLVICDVPASVPGGTWNEDGVIIFAANNAPGLFRVSAAGGTVTPITVVDRSRGETNHRSPQFLPDGRRFLYLRVSNKPENQGIYVGSIDAKLEEQSLTQVLASNRQGMYTALPTGSGRLLFLRDTTLFSQPFDLKSLTLSGEPTPVADQVGSFSPATAGLFAVSQTGILTYRVGAEGDQQRLTLYDDQGKTAGTVGDKGAYFNPALSPDGTKLAVAVFARENGNSNIWVIDVARGNNTKVTFNAGRDDFPVWSPDGKSIVFSSNRNGHRDLYLKNADGTGEDRLLLKSDSDKRATSWSKDGRFLLYMTDDPKTATDIWVLPNPSGASGDAKPVPYLQTEFREGFGSFSPDGRWVAYVSIESGSPQVYVRPFYPERIGESAAGGRWLLSHDAIATTPAWRADGKMISYVTSTGHMTAVSVNADKTSFQFEAPRSLFSVPILAAYDMTADGKRFVVALPEGANTQSPFIVVTNWQAVLQK